MSENQKVALAFVCVDARLHHEESGAMGELRKFLGVDLLFPITSPGPDKVLVSGSQAAQETMSQFFHFTFDDFHKVITYPVTGKLVRRVKRKY